MKLVSEVVKVRSCPGCLMRADRRALSIPRPRWGCRSCNSGPLTDIHLRQPFASRETGMPADGDQVHLDLGDHRVPSDIDAAFYAKLRTRLLAPLLNADRAPPGWGPMVGQLRMFTARETTTATVKSDARDCSVMRSLAHGVSGMVSVGLKAVALVKDV
jgi:hypothetical protein